MSDTPRLFIASQFSGQVYVKALKQDGPVTALVTYPAPDYARDQVKPDGGDWSAYPNHNYVNWSHRVPIGRGTVNHRILRHNGDLATVAVGETTFLRSKADVEGLDLRRRDPRTHRFWNKEAPYTIDDVLQCASQSERLIRDEIANGVSVEFDVDETKKGRDWWDLKEPSVLENRPARHFEIWKGLGYAHARNPVNPGCQTVAEDPRFKPTSAAIEKAIVIAQTGKLPGGEALCPIMLKSFDDLANYRSPNVSVLVEGTPPQSGAAATDTTQKTDDKQVVVKGEVTDDIAGDSGSGMGAGHTALMDAVQGLSDICSNLSGNKSDDLSLRKFAKKVCEKLKGIAGDIKARAEKHKAKLDSSESTDDDTDPMDEDDYEPTVEEKAIETNAEGAVITKAFPDWKPRRMTFTNLAPVTAPEPTQIKAPVEDTVSPEEERKALKRLHRAIKKAQPHLEAAAANGVI